MANEATPRTDKTMPLLTALRASVPDGLRGHLSATERCVLNADDEGYGGELAEQALVEFKRPQAFFASLATSIVTPHVGDVYRDAVMSILNRAIGAGLYKPELK